MTDYTLEFKKVVETGVYIGTGNPNSEILIVGKEVATDIEDGADIELETKNLKSFHNNNCLWKKNIEQNLQQENVPKWNIANKDNNPLYAFRGVKINREGHTWKKYQKLNNYIFDKKNNPEINFQEDFFITETSEIPSKTTRKAINKKVDFKAKLQERKNSFFKSDFIQNFPIVILACSNYFKNNDEIREIDNTFGVEYIGDENGKYFYSKGNWFFIHKDKCKSKLVIHTRQLSTDVKNDLLTGIGNVVRHFKDREL